MFFVNPSVFGCCVYYHDSKSRSETKWGIEMENRWIGVAVLYAFLIQQEDEKTKSKFIQLIHKELTKEVQIAFFGHFSAGKSSMINIAWMHILVWWWMIGMNWWYFILQSVFLKKQKAANRESLKRKSHPLCRSDLSD